MTQGSGLTSADVTTVQESFLYLDNIQSVNIDVGTYTDLSASNTYAAFLTSVAPELVLSLSNLEISCHGTAATNFATPLTPAHTSQTASVSAGISNEGGAIKISNDQSVNTLT